MRMMLLALLFVCVAGIDATILVPLEDGRVEFRANETFLLLGNNFTGDYRTCLQYRAYVEGKRTKLNVYLCRMAVGGRCSSGVVRATNGQTQCYSLRPWMKFKDHYAFYFAFQRRQRHWNEHEDDHDGLMHRHKRHSKSTRTVGVLQLDGLVDCIDACKDEGSGSDAL